MHGASFCIMSHQKKQTTIDEAIQLFNKFSRLRHSKLSTRTYLQYLANFKKFCAEQSINHVASVTLEHCYDFAQWLEDQQYQQSTISYHMSAIRQLFNTTLSHQLTIMNPMDIPIPEYDCVAHTPMTRNDYNKMIAAMRTLPTTFKTLRDELVIRLLFFTGMRVSELCNSRVQDLELSERYMRIKTSKKRKHYRIVGCWDNETAYVLDQYLTMRESYTTHNYLIVNLDHRPHKKNNQITTRSIERIFIQTTKLAKIKKKLVPHSARHGWAITMMRKNMHPRYIQTALGHSNLSTLQVYTQIFDEDIVKKLKKYSKK